MIVLNKEHIIDLHRTLIDKFGGTDGIRDEGLLESAIAAPYQGYDDLEFYPTVEEKAAKLAYGLISNHAFLDGNKRIGAAAMLVMLDLNNIEIKYDQDDLYNIIISVANGNAGFVDLYNWIIVARKNVIDFLE